MELDDRALPLTRGQLDIWLAQEAGHSATEWHLGLFVRIEGMVERDALKRAIRQAIQEAEPVRAAIFEVDGQVFQRAIDYPDVELAFHDLSGSRHPVQEARRIATVYAAIIAGTPIPPAFFGSLQDLVRCESEYEASTDYPDDQAYWTKNLPAESGAHRRLPRTPGERDPYWPSAPVRLDPAVVRRVQELSQVWK